MIKISVVSYNNEVSSEPLSAVFGPSGASIGRGTDNFLVLQDPKRYVSRLQASVKSDGLRHSIVNLSQANPILVNGEEIALGQDVDLHYGDEIQIGLYLLKAEAPTAESSQSGHNVENGPFVAPAARTSAPASGAMSSHADKADGNPPIGAVALDLSNLGGSGSDPFADILGTAANVPAASEPANRSATVAPIPVVPPKPIPVQAPAADPLGFDDLLGLSSAPAHGPAAGAGRQATPADPFGFDDLLGPTSKSPVGHATMHDNAFGFDDLLSGPSHAPLPPERNAAIIPDDFDPFAMPSEAPRNNHDPLSGMAHANVSLDSIAGNRATIDGLLLATNGGAGPSLLDPIALGPAHSSETDPLALFASESILPTKQVDRFSGDVASNHVSELKSHFAMPQARQETAPPVSPILPETVTPPLPPQPVPLPPNSNTVVTPAAPVKPEMFDKVAPAEKPPAKSAKKELQAAPNQEPLDGRALAEAFMRGANLPLDTIPSGVTLEWMEMMGRFVATATDGAVELIASRALVKREVKADLTMIVVRNNNPLKFLPDGQSALIQMLGKKIPGFMNPVEAMQDAYIDLRAHQIGVVAGMRAALDEVLRRFDPAMLEKKLKTRTLIDSLVAANRKAKMWDLYAELFKEIYIEAQDDFQTLFGKAFLTAYENEIERFRQGSQA